MHNYYIYVEHSLCTQNAHSGSPATVRSINTLKVTSFIYLSRRLILTSNIWLELHASFYGVITSTN